MAAELEFLNSFFTQRLVAVAGEIYQAVKHTIIEYQGELNRVNQENRSLRTKLAEESGSNGAGCQSSGTVPQEVPNFSQEPLDAKPPVIQAKVEDAESQEPFNGPSSSSSSWSPSAVTADQEPSNRTSGQTAHEGQVDNSGVTLKEEPWDYEVICIDDAPKTQKESVVDHLLKDQPTPSTHCPPSLVQSQAAERLVYCEFCGKPFGNREQLKQHLVIHKNERPRPYRCELCGKSYSYAQVLEIHHRTHTGERPYHCRFCERRFRQKSHLKDHERIHTGERPYSCSVCGKRFIQKSQVKNHNCNPL